MFSRRLTVFHWPTPVGNPFAKGCFESTTGNAPLPAILERGFSPSVFAFASTKRSSITQNLDTQIVHFACPYSSKRSSELKLLDLRFMRILPEGVEFKLPGLTKTSSEVISVFFAKYEEREELCVLRCLQCYIARTSPFRPIMGSNSASQLLISYHRPHNPVKSCSIARWIKSILGSAGIDTSIFKGHSTRSASTLKARAGGVPL